MFRGVFAFFVPCFDLDLQAFLQAFRGNSILQTCRNASAFLCSKFAYCVVREQPCKKKASHSKGCEPVTVDEVEPNAKATTEYSKHRGAQPLKSLNRIVVCLQLLLYLFSLRVLHKQATHLRPLPPCRTQSTGGPHFRSKPLSPMVCVKPTLDDMEAEKGCFSLTQGRPHNRNELS